MSQHIPAAHTQMTSHPQRLSLSSDRITSERSAMKSVGESHLHFVNYQLIETERSKVKDQTGEDIKFRCVKIKKKQT